MSAHDGTFTRMRTLLGRSEMGSTGVAEFGVESIFGAYWRPLDFGGCILSKLRCEIFDKKI